MHFRESASKYPRDLSQVIIISHRERKLLTFAARRVRIGSGQGASRQAMPLQFGKRRENYETGTRHCTGTRRHRAVFAGHRSRPDGLRLRPAPHRPRHRGHPRGHRGPDRTVPQEHPGHPCRAGHDPGRCGQDYGLSGRHERLC